MAKNQKNLQNLLMNLSKKSSIITAILILFPLSIISFLLSCNYDFCHSLLSQFHSIKNSLSKKAVFCLFNAILLFLAKDFGLLVSSADFPHPKGENQPPTLTEETKQAEMVKPDVLMEEEEVVGEMKEVDIDELNRKFEEFIERVKRERQMEAEQQQLMVA